ncbi:hypothetical protein CUMW_086110 [Citrus unshiu]|nr:hypothetical protein CUMW_086110 [Citrus unshiu]
MRVKRQKRTKVMALLPFSRATRISLVISRSVFPNCSLVFYAYYSASQFPSLQIARLFTLVERDLVSSEVNGTFLLAAKL